MAILCFRHSRRSWVLRFGSAAWHEASKPVFWSEFIFPLAACGSDSLELGLLMDGMIVCVYEENSSV